MLATSGGYDAQANRWEHLQYLPYALLRRTWQWHLLTTLRQTLKTDAMKFTFRTLFHSTKAILEEPPIEEEDERYTAYFMATTSCFYIQFPLITTSC